MAVTGALAIMGLVAGIDDGRTISKMTIWSDNNGSLKIQLQERDGGQQVQKAPQYSAGMLVSLELYVVSERTKYPRLLAWSKLMKTWAMLRFDDMQGLAHTCMTLGTKGWKWILTRTESTGPVKQVGEVPVFIHRQDGCTSLPWLEEGVYILGEPADSARLDLFLQAPGLDPEIPGSRMLTYSECSALPRKLLLEL